MIRGPRKGKQMQIRLADGGRAFATRERARAIVEPLAVGHPPQPLLLDLDGVQAASPSFVDELMGQLAARYETVDVTGAIPGISELIERVTARRKLQSRIRLIVEA